MNGMKRSERTKAGSRGRRAGVLLIAALVLGPSLVLAGSGPAGAGPGIGMVCTGGDTFDLVATDGYISTPDGNAIYMWGYAPAGQPFQMPGPVLCVEQGDEVTVNLDNDLTVPVSIVFPGQVGVTSSGGVPGLIAREAPPGGSVSYSFVASEPGTYLYESGTEPDKQVQMGLYGALVVRPLGHPNWAYDDPSTEFDPALEYLILIHDIDPSLHVAVEQGRAYRITDMHDRYWTINGRSFPDTIAGNGVAHLPDQPYGALVFVEASDSAGDLPALIRYANAGMVSHPFHPHGNHLRVIARDGRLLVGPGGEDLSVEAFTKTIGSGQTYDLLFRWIDVEGWSSTGNPLPVELPELQDLVFKDDFTFYSGSPYLGEKDDLPAGVTDFNACGEFYFPWHTHALNEFQNFNEGFGGLATVVLVNPAGGCVPEEEG